MWVLCHVVVVMVLWIEDGCGQEISKHTALSGFIYFELQQFKLSHSVKLVSQSLAFSLALYSLTQSLNHSATQSVSQLNLPMFFNCQSSIQFNFSIDFQLIVNHCLQHLLCQSFFVIFKVFICFLSNQFYLFRSGTFNLQIY